jgi:hypothetical protein
VPKVELTRRQHETAVAMAGIGYGYDLEELGKAQFARRGGAADRHARVVEKPGETLGRVAHERDLVDELLRGDVNGQLIGIFTGSNTVEMADTLLLPYEQMLGIGLRRLDDSVEAAKPDAEHLLVGQQQGVGHLDGVRSGEDPDDQVALMGDPAKGFSGLLNHPGVTVGSAAATGADGSRVSAISTVFDPVKIPISWPLTSARICSGVFRASPCWTGSGATTSTPWRPARS